MAIATIDYTRTKDFLYNLLENKKFFAPDSSCLKNDSFAWTEYFPTF